MNFSLYDLLSQLVPGFIVYLSLLRAIGIQWDKDYVVASTIIAFFIGFFVNTLASWLEDFYCWTWRGKPSKNLLNGKDIRTVKLYNSVEIKELLKTETLKSDPSDEELFGIAMRYATGVKDTRIDTFNANYAFARGVLTSCIIVFITLICKQEENHVYYYGVGLGVLMSWQRCKERSYYFVREVLQTYMRLKRPIKTE
jgi:hypothetical protein